ncbi:hypothetical protein M427DRAFT_371514 [Gonapodya prolifera JEL478]|uniref:F-box domain-containing protein n=1 Tax=Gonapodya prolifera (strain JEL478) TaxID=1344416 RepID=A0A139A9R8_GONPJ|nr:hypothetical protein M427DRAFT_371514 [Gonapodya prolifera JEL478]|eukprot:KXS13419.1 hypothetical protein M427DRAFT_371514 [Gonapodya prolifera JEL478]
MASFSSLPYKTAISIFAYLPVRSRIRLGSSSRALHGILRVGAFWQDVDFSEYGLILGDVEFEKCVGLFAKWTSGTSNGDSRTKVMAEFRKIVLDDTAITTWTVMKLIYQRKLVFLSISPCRNMSLSQIVQNLSARTQAANVRDRLPSLEHEESQLRILKAGLENGPPVDTTQHLSRAAFDTFPNLLELYPKVCHDCGYSLPESSGYTPLSWVRSFLPTSAAGGYALPLDITNLPSSTRTFCSGCVELSVCWGCGCVDRTNTFTLSVSCRGCYGYSIMCPQCIDRSLSCSHFGCFEKAICPRCATVDGWAILPPLFCHVCNGGPFCDDHFEVCSYYVADTLTGSGCQLVWCSTCSSTRHNCADCRSPTCPRCDGVGVDKCKECTSAPDKGVDSMGRASV